MTYSQARQNFSTFLDQARKDGEAYITRSDGSRFKVVPVEQNLSSVSPFQELSDYAKSINSNISDYSMKNLLKMLKEDEDFREDKILSSASRKKASDYFNILNKNGYAK